MTNTEFIVRSQNGGRLPLFKETKINFGFSFLDGVLLLLVLATFIGLVFLLSK